MKTSERPPAQAGLPAQTGHEPVMVREALEALHLNKGAFYIDATVGTGGHAIEIGRRGGRVLGIDMDKTMLEVARRRLIEVCPTPFKAERCYSLVQGNFRDIDKIAKDAGFEKVSGILFDLGVSKLHLTSPARGFSFASPKTPLDMRLDPESQGVTASNLVNVLRPDQLRRLFSETMEVSAARWLSRRIIERRGAEPIETVGDFLEVCRGLKGKSGLHPATLPFLALRLAVNSELENLQEGLPKAFKLLEPEGRLVVIGFHSGEERIVKNFFRDKEGAEAEVLTKKPILPAPEEIQRNPGARSAKMRVLEKR